MNVTSFIHDLLGGSRRRLRVNLCLGTILALALVLSTGSGALADSNFPDVPQDHPYAAAIADLSSRGIINGYPNGDFGPDDPVKRAQFAKMVLGTMDVSPNTGTTTRFTDLGSPDANGYPHVYVQAAFDHGITTGTNLAQTLFRPWDSIRRDQMATMLVRAITNITPGALSYPPPHIQSSFPGVPEPHGQNLRIAEYNGLFEGLLGFGPNWSVTAYTTRGEVAQMLHNQLSQRVEQAIHYFLHQGQWTGEDRLVHWDVVIGYAMDPDDVLITDDSPGHLLISFIPNETGQRFTLEAWPVMPPGVDLVQAEDDASWPEWLRPYAAEIGDALSDGAWVSPK